MRSTSSAAIEYLEAYRYLSDLCSDIERIAPQVKTRYSLDRDVSTLSYVIIISYRINDLSSDYLERVCELSKDALDCFARDFLSSVKESISLASSQSSRQNGQPHTRRVRFATGSTPRVRVP